MPAQPTLNPNYSTINNFVASGDLLLFLRARLRPCRVPSDNAVSTSAAEDSGSCLMAVLVSLQVDAGVMGTRSDLLVPITPASRH
jgi:hypothetical protein